MTRRDALIVMAAGAALVLVWGYAGLPFPGRYSSTDRLVRLDTWTGEAVHMNGRVVLPAGPGAPRQR